MCGHLQLYSYICRENEGVFLGEYRFLDRYWMLSDWVMTLGVFMMPVLIQKAKDDCLSDELRCTLKVALATRVDPALWQDKSNTNALFKFAKTLDIMDSSQVSKEAANKFVDSMGLKMFEGFFKSWDCLVIHCIISNIFYIYQLRMFCQMMYM